jgi:hypothetical protein
MVRFNWGPALVWGTLAIAALLLPVGASAAILTFEHSADGSGTLNGKPFDLSKFVITATGDTKDIQFFGGGMSIDHLSASIDIQGLGVFQILTPTRTFNSQAGQLVGFSRAGTLGNDLLNGPFNAAFATWDMTTPIGPFTGQGGLLQWGLDPQINTSGGILIFNDAVTTVTFRAFIPEPATALLIVAVGLTLRRP